jgi:hypothetical protein
MCNEMKHIIIKWFSILAITLSAVSCSRVTRYSFKDDYEQTNVVYYTREVTIVRVKLADFLARGEENIAIVSQQDGLDYRMILGMAWLRLAAICRVQNEETNFEYAMSHAILYFDRIDGFVSDRAYQANKVNMLIGFLERLDKNIPPRWRSDLARIPQGRSEEVKARP